MKNQLLTLIQLTLASRFALKTQYNTDKKDIEKNYNKLTSVNKND